MCHDKHVGLKARQADEEVRKGGAAWVKFNFGADIVRWNKLCNDIKNVFRDDRVDRGVHDSCVGRPEA